MLIRQRKQNVANNASSVMKRPRIGVPTRTQTTTTTKNIIIVMQMRIHR